MASSTQLSGLLRFAGPTGRCCPRRGSAWLKNRLGPAHGVQRGARSLAVVTMRRAARWYNGPTANGAARCRGGGCWSTSGVREMCRAYSWRWGLTTVVTRRWGGGKRPSRWHSSAEEGARWSSMARWCSYNFVKAGER
jgi:hypothetical protein